MIHLFKSNGDGFNTVFVENLNEMGNCPIENLGLLINGKIYRAVGFSSQDNKKIILECMQLVRYDLQLTPKLLVEFIQAKTRHDLGQEYRKQNDNFWYPDEGLDDDDPQNEFWFLRNENFRLIIDGEDTWNKSLNLFDNWTMVAINAFAELYQFWLKYNINICTPFIQQKESLKVDPELFDKSITFQKQMLGL